MTLFAKQFPWLLDALKLDAPQVPNELTNEVVPVINQFQDGWANLDARNIEVSSGIANGAIVGGQLSSMLPNGVQLTDQQCALILGMSIKNTTVGALSPTVRRRAAGTILTGTLLLSVGVAAGNEANVSANFAGVWPFFLPPKWELIDTTGAAGGALLYRVDLIVLPYGVKPPNAK